MEDRTLLSGTTFTVNSAVDAAGNGLQTGATSGDLRWCIYQADQVANANSTIVFDPSFLKSTSTIVLSYGELEISESTTITGPGAANLTISGGNSSRVFNIESQSANVIISGLTIAKGNASPANIGAAGNQGGDIFNSGNLTLTNDVVENGEALGAPVGPFGRGGGIFNASNAVLTLNATTVENNLAQGLAGTQSTTGGPGQGGGIFNDSFANLTLNAGSQVIGNQALGGNGYNGIPGTGSGAAGTDGGNATGLLGTGTNGGTAAGGGIFNNTDGTLTISADTSAKILISQNLAQSV